MKNLVKKSVLMAILMIALVSKASEKGLRVEVISHENKVVQLFLSNRDGSSEVLMKDIDGFQFYKVQIDGKEFSKKFDLSRLPNGKYYIEINSQTKIKTLPFTVESDNVVFNKEAIVFKPVVRFKDDIVYVSKFTLNNETLGVFLYDENEHLLHSQKLSGENSLNLKLNLSNLKMGSYSLVLRSGGKLYQEIIKKS